MSHPTPASPTSAAAPEGPRTDQTFIPPDPACGLGQFLSGQPLLVTESLSDYEHLLARVVSALRPSDVIAEIAAKDFADLTWEIERLKCLKAKQLAEGIRWKLVGALEGLRSLGNRHVIDRAGACSRAIACLNGDAAARAEVSAILQQAALDWDTITARAMEARADVLAQMERYITVAEVRRARVLTELERRQDTLSRRLRPAAR